uniref:Oligosaccharyltransferase complex subunit n=1 Tax=Syphacia muris TaxID=451379 RepID=A0A0N5AGS9_9BILA
MEAVFDTVFFSIVDPPNVRLTWPRWVKMPSPMQVLALIMITYFMVTGGVIYDVINEPPSVGQTTDERGNARPVAIMQYRVNGQYIMEGLAASFMFTVGGLGLIILDKCNDPLTPKLNRLLMLGFGFTCLIIGYVATRIFMRIKMPSYLY